MWTWFAGDKTFLVMHSAATAALLGAVIVPVTALVIGLAIVPARLVVALSCVVALSVEDFNSRSQRVQDWKRTPSLYFLRLLSP